MQLDQFNYDLPKQLIASRPLARRSDSRLMVLNRQSGAFAHKQFIEIERILQPNDLLVLNNTRVLPARLQGRKQSGGRFEALVETIVDEHSAWLMIKASNAPAVGALLIPENAASQNNEGTADALALYVKEKTEGRYLITLWDRSACAPSALSVAEFLQAYGEMPLPPYIGRDSEQADRERYQTVFAQTDGAVAAPTAGLHFDKKLLAKLASRGIETAYVTLHVGAGTFQPVRVASIKDHTMHHEWLEVKDEVCEKIRLARKRGGRVVAVGTTSVRCLETAQGKPFKGNTSIFIYPGYTFRQVDGLLTNFHLPKSTLIMLVAAFAGLEETMQAYHEAIRQQYRFYSYGDAMLIV